MYISWNRIHQHSSFDLINMISKAVVGLNDYEAAIFHFGVQTAINKDLGLHQVRVGSLKVAEVASKPCLLVATFGLSLSLLYQMIADIH